MGMYFLDVLLNVGIIRACNDAWIILLLLPTTHNPSPQYSRNGHMFSYHRDLELMERCHVATYYWRISLPRMCYLGFHLDTSFSGIVSYYLSFCLLLLPSPPLFLKFRERNPCVEGKDSSIAVHTRVVGDLLLCNVLSRLDYEVWFDKWKGEEVQQELRHMN